MGPGVTSYVPREVLPQKCSRLSAPETKQGNPQPSSPQPCSTSTLQPRPRGPSLRQPRPRSWRYQATLLSGPQQVSLSVGASSTHVAAAWLWELGRCGPRKKPQNKLWPSGTAWGVGGMNWLKSISRNPTRSFCTFSAKLPGSRQVVLGVGGALHGGGSAKKEGASPGGPQPPRAPKPCWSDPEHRQVWPKERGEGGLDWGAAVSWRLCPPHWAEGGFRLQSPDPRGEEGAEGALVFGGPCALVAPSVPVPARDSPPCRLSPHGFSKAQGAAASPPPPTSEQWGPQRTPLMPGRERSALKSP